MDTRLVTQTDSIFSFHGEIDPTQSLSYVQSAFQSFDQDSSGFLKKTQFMKFMNQIIIDLGGQIPPFEAIQQIMDLLDVNGDGQISKSQILKLFQSMFQLLKQKSIKTKQK